MSRATPSGRVSSSGTLSTVKIPVALMLFQKSAKTTESGDQSLT